MNKYIWTIIFNYFSNDDFHSFSACNKNALVMCAPFNKLYKDNIVRLKEHYGELDFVIRKCAIKAFYVQMKLKQPLSHFGFYGLLFVHQEQEIRLVSHAFGDKKQKSLHTMIQTREKTCKSYMKVEEQIKDLNLLIFYHAGQVQFLDNSSKPLKELLNIDFEGTRIPSEQCVKIRQVFEKLELPNNCARFVFDSLHMTRIPKEIPLFFPQMNFNFRNNHIYRLPLIPTEMFKEIDGEDEPISGENELIGSSCLYLRLQGNPLTAFAPSIQTWPFSQLPTLEINQFQRPSLLNLLDGDRTRLVVSLPLSPVEGKLYNFEVCRIKQPKIEKKENRCIVS